MFSVDTNGFIQLMLMPDIGIAGEVDFLGKLIEDIDGEGLFEVVLNPVGIVVFYKQAGVGTCHEIVLFDVLGDDAGVDGIDELFRSREYLRPGAEGEEDGKNPDDNSAEHILSSKIVR